MICAEAEPLLGACLDGELDAKTALGIEEHLSGCDACATAYRKLEGLRDEIVAAELDWSKGVDLRGLRASIRRRNHTSWWQRVQSYPLLLAAATAALLLVVFLPGRFAPANAGMVRQIVDNHVRSLMAEHLVDVPSSDRHTVKPWFQGKLGFAPTVPDLTADGFVLIGGRLDVIGSRPAAAIVYKRQNHVINLWIASTETAGRGPEATNLDGYNLIRWQQNGMTYWAASDLNLAELRQFEELIRSRS
jgi:anti-sigma factor RsiW